MKAPPNKEIHAVAILQQIRLYREAELELRGLGLAGGSGGNLEGPVDAQRMPVFLSSTEKESRRLPFPAGGAILKEEPEEKVERGEGVSPFPVFCDHMKQEEGEEQA